MMPCRPEPLNPPKDSAHAEASQAFVIQGRCRRTTYAPEVHARPSGKRFPSGMDSESDCLHGQLPMADSDRSP